MRKKILAFLLLFSIFIPQIAVAQSTWDKNKDDVIYGIALNQNQRDQVNAAFGLKDMANVNQGEVDGNDLEKYLGYSTDNSNMISSVYVKRLQKNSGIKVNIVTPANITQISPGQYTNAAITAGITDADIFVGSPTQVTGESALVGVYKSEAMRGVTIEPERAKTAQDELETVNKVAEENKSKDNFDEVGLDKAVIEVKQKLADHKKETGETASTEQIVIYVEDALKDVNMENVLSDNNINILVNFFNQYQNTSAVDSEEVRQNLIKFGNEIADNASQFYSDNKDSIDKVVKDAQDSGLLDSFMNFIQSIINSFMRIFNGDNNNQ